MKLTRMIVATPLVALASCAGGPQASSGDAYTGSSGAQYCKRDRLTTQGDKLACPWAATFAQACENTNLSTLAKDAVASGPTNAGRCANGQWMVTVTTK